MTLLRVYAREIGLSRTDVAELENGDLKIKFIDDFLFMDESLFRKCKTNLSVRFDDSCLVLGLGQS